MVDCRQVLDVIQRQEETTDLHEQFHALVSGCEGGGREGTGRHRSSRLGKTALPNT